MQASNCVENALCHGCFSKNLTKIYRTAILRTLSKVCEEKTGGTLTRKCSFKGFLEISYKKPHTKAADAFAGLSRRGILKVTESDIQYRRFNMRFSNKAPPVPVIAENVHDIHQMYLINM